MADNQIAATLAAALVQVAGKDIAKLKKMPAEFAVEVYFQCVDALAAETKKRTTSSHKPLNL